MNKLLLLIFGMVSPLCIQNLEAVKPEKDTKDFQNIPSEETIEIISPIEFPETDDINTTETELKGDICNNNKEIALKALIETLNKSLIYLGNLVKSMQTICNKVNNRYIAFQLSAFINKIEDTKASINNCIYHLRLEDDKGLMLVSAESMGILIDEINAFLENLNERNILKVNIEDHGTLIQTSVIKLQALLQ